MADTYSLAAVALKTIIDATFTPEGIVARHDRIHDSLGHERPACGISPTQDVPFERIRVAEQTYVTIRFWNKWDKRIDPTQEVDPRIITALAERLKGAIRTATVTKSGDLWFFSVERTEYPEDPTGNMTRFVMTVKVWSNNSTLVETT